MKKIIFALFVVVTALMLTLQTFAASGVFSASPSGKAAPELIKGVNEDDTCVAQVVICAYSDRNTLNEADKLKLEAAYVSIANATDLANLNVKLDELAKSLQISSDKLAVSDLFNVGYSDCAEHNNHGKFIVTIKPVVIDNFACLMYYDGSAWIVVEDVELDEEAATLTFNMADCAPYAIVMHDGSAIIPATASINISSIICWYFLIIILAIIILFLIMYKKSKKEKEEQ